MRHRQRRYFACSIGTADNSRLIIVVRQCGPTVIVCRRESDTDGFYRLQNGFADDFLKLEEFEYWLFSSWKSPVFIPFSFAIFSISVLTSPGNKVMILKSIVYFWADRRKMSLEAFPALCKLQFAAAKETPS
jgi:hypothetical protein